MDKMDKFNQFMDILAGVFDNSEQYQSLKEQNIDFPLAKHIHRICNDKIIGLPKDFEGKFMVQESYYTGERGTRAQPHFFLFVPVEEGVKLISYKLPAGYDQESFTYANIDSLDYNELEESTKFTPAVFVEKDGVWEGGSVSMFSPVLKFSLDERFSADHLEVSESMEMNGKRTFGFDRPIIYKRVK